MTGNDLHQLEVVHLAGKIRLVVWPLVLALPGCLSVLGTAAARRLGILTPMTMMRAEGTSKIEAGKELT